MPLLVQVRRPERSRSPGGVDFLNCYVHDTVARPVFGFKAEKGDFPLRDVHGQILASGPGKPTLEVGAHTENVDLAVTSAPE